MRNTLRQNIEISRQKYLLKLSRKFTCSEINPKCYWLVLNNFLNNKKIPCIHPVINKIKIATDFKEKSEFSSFLAKQCVLIENASTLRTDLLRKIDKSLNNIFFSEEDYLTTIRRLDPSKARGHDQINIRMIELCDKAL